MSFLKSPRVLSGGQREREGKRLSIEIGKHIESIEPYKPGKPLEELERELGIKDAIKLASNENPLGPSKKALAVLKKGLTGLHRYPEGSGRRLREAIAQAGTGDSWKRFG
jgi:histidinol-phosphate/aromatic aminotransferase/cobyric acid decarboxylase-like protein